MNLRMAYREKLAAGTALGATIWIVIAFMSWRRIDDGTRVGSPFTNHDYGQQLLFDGSVQAPAFIGVILLHICAAIIGYACVIYPIWGNRRLASDIWLALAGVVPGTLVLITLSRVTTLFVSNPWAPSIVACFAVIGTLVSIAGIARHPGRLMAMTATGNWAALGGAVALLIAIFVFTVHIDRFHVVGEASIWFMQNVFLSDQYGIGSVGRFPFVSQHYDEAALLYPVIYGLMHRGANEMGTFTAIYWVMLALGRAGVGALLYIAVRSLGTNRLSSIVIVAFVCGASLSVNPLSSHLLFDSLSPLAYALHVARFLTPVLPLVLIAAFARWEKDASFSSLAISVILGIGFSSMPVHGILLLPWGIVVALLATASPSFATSSGAWRAACAAALLALIACTFTYASASLFPVNLRVLVLFGASLAGSIIFLLAWFRSVGKQQFRSLGSAPVLIMIAISLGYALGVLFLGNVFIPRTLGILGHIWPWAGIGVAERGLQPVGISSWQLIQSPYCEEGYPWGFRVLTGHCGSLPMFVRTYGLGFVLIASVVAWKCFGRGCDNSMPDRQLTWILLGMILCVIALPVFFIVYDFLSPLDSPIGWQRDLSVWLRSRLVEPWFYGGMLLALVFFLAEASIRERRLVQSIMMIAIAVFALSPLVMPAQMIANFSYLLRVWI
jgi:hypothetical protein